MNVRQIQAADLPTLETFLAKLKARPRLDHHGREQKTAAEAQIKRLKKTARKAQQVPVTA